MSSIKYPARSCLLPHRMCSDRPTGKFKISKDSWNKLVSSWTISEPSWETTARPTSIVTRPDHQDWIFRGWSRSLGSVPSRWTCRISKASAEIFVSRAAALSSHLLRIGRLPTRLDPRATFPPSPRSMSLTCFWVSIILCFIRPLQYFIGPHLPMSMKRSTGTARCRPWPQLGARCFLASLPVVCYTPRKHLMCSSTRGRCISKHPGCWSTSGRMSSHLTMLVPLCWQAFPWPRWTWNLQHGSGWDLLWELPRTSDCTMNLAPGL